MNFDRENQTPNITGLPDSQDFRNPQNQQVNPFIPPEYQEVLTSNQEDVEQAFEEQEIANWQAQDLIIGEKGKKWYVGFFFVVAILVGLAIFMQSWSFVALILVSALGIVVLRKSNHAQIISYSLSTHGVYMGENFHSYDEFRAFGILQEENVYSIILLPKKRFSPSTTIYFNKEDGEKITDIIGVRLPMEEVQLDIIDRIVRKMKL